jgi:single-stranded DNA-specific DHH superfamily exonuclease
MSFALKDRTSNVVRMLKFLMNVKSPQEILKDEPRNHMLFRYGQVNKKYQRLIEKARKFTRGKIVYFQYGGDLSLSGDIANELAYRFPGKIVVVAYIKGTKANISLRGSNVKEITKKAIEGFQDATGGGHENATGAKLNVEDLPKFKEKLEKLVK